MVIDKAKSKTPIEEKPVQNRNKNLQSFLKVSLVEKEVTLCIYFKRMYMSNRILLNVK